MRTVLLAAGICAALASATVATADAVKVETVTADVIDAVVATRNARVIYVLPFGQFYHRFDHVLASGQLELKPEAAIERGYTRCPECMPPRTTEELNLELASGPPKTTRYYQEYLKERAHATLTAVPPGTLPVLDPPHGGGSILQAPRAAPLAAPAAPAAPRR